MVKKQRGELFINATFGIPIHKRQFYVTVKLISLNT